MMEAYGKKMYDGAISAISIRKAAEEMLRTDPFFGSSCPDSYIIDVIEHVIREDRKRRDNLEEMLIKLAGKVPAGFKRYWYVAMVNKTLKQYIRPIEDEKSKSDYPTPTEAVRAALEELKNKEDEK